MARPAFRPTVAPFECPPHNNTATLAIIIMDQWVCSTLHPLLPLVHSSSSPITADA